MNEPRDVGVAPVVQGNDTAMGTERSQAVFVPNEQLPAIVSRRAGDTRRLWMRALMLLTVVSLGAAGGMYWWLHRPLPLPPGIAYGNGRIEADPIDIATKFAGRIAELRVDEGDMVTAGQAVAVMDTKDLEATLKRAQAQVEQMSKGIRRPMPSSISFTARSCSPIRRWSARGRC